MSSRRTNLIPFYLATLAILLSAQNLCAQPLAKANETLVLTNVSVIDGNGGPPRSNMTIVISSGKIAAMFPSGGRRLPSHATVMNLRGHFVIPGLIDSHYHLVPSHWPGEEGIARRRFALLGGVTTVRDMAGDAVALKDLANEGARPETQLPRIYYSALMAGPTWFTDPRVKEISHDMAPGEAPWARAITTSTNLRKAVSEAKATGAIGIKLYADLSPDEVTRLTKEAHRQGLKVWSHATVFPSRPSDAVSAGVDVISHSVDLVFQLNDKLPETLAKASYSSVNWNSSSPDAPAITALLKRMRKQGTVLDATLYIMVDDPKDADTPRALWAYEVTRRAHQLGVTIVAGTDYPERPRRREFPNIHIEMELLVTKAGLTPLQAISAATRNGARVLGIADSYGTITKGKVADLVILSADPSKDILNTRKIVFVIKGGKTHKREKVIMPS